MKITTLAASSLAAEATVLGKGRDSAPGRQVYELRAYRLKTPAMHSRLDGYLAKALIPALNQAGILPVGIFYQSEERDSPTVYVLIPYPTADAFLTISAELNRDPKVRSDGADYLDAAKDNSVFDRIDTWLLLAFSGMPQMNLPEYSLKKRPRIFELRTYESHSESKALKKIEMFNSGEIELMKSLEMGPIFFGQALTGSALPHLTYMLSGTDTTAHNKHWDNFRKHPVWEKMKNDPQYADTVSKITTEFLIPASFSQI